MISNTETKIRYLTETARALCAAGFNVEQTAEAKLAVIWEGQKLCDVSEISDVGGITYRNENIATPERVVAKDKAYRIVCTTAEYMRLMETAPSLSVKGLERYKVLADFNDTVLACSSTKFGVQFVTWDWDHDRKGVSHGHYFMENYLGAKQDFAIRSGLITEQQLFKDAQLIEIYRCCADTLDAGFDLTYEQEKCIKSVQEQIENGMPDIMERIREQDQHTVEPYPQSQTM